MLVVHIDHNCLNNILSDLRLAPKKLNSKNGTLKTRSKHWKGVEASVAIDRIDRNPLNNVLSNLQLAPHRLNLKLEE